MSLPEVLLWQELRDRPDGIKFRRQHAIGDYVLDFYCASARLAIEIDGRSHDTGDRPQRDVTRDSVVAAKNIRCVRIAAKAVLADPVAVAAWLAQLAATPRPTAPPPSQERWSPSPLRGEDQGRAPCP